jgi:flagellar assembly protein FliH
MRGSIVDPESGKRVQPVSWRSLAPPPRPAASDPHWQQEIEQRIREAHEAGFRQAEAAAAQAFEGQLRPMLERLTSSIAEIAEFRSGLLRKTEADVVKLSLEIAKRILHRELAGDPAVLEGLIVAALRKLESHEIYRVRVHPEHEPVVRTALARLGRGGQIEIAGDPGLERGGAVFELARGLLDASIDAQLREVERELGI